MTAQALLSPGQKVQHSQFGEGVVIELPIDGYVRIFFQTGEKRVPLDSLKAVYQRNQRILSQVSADPQKLRAIWLTYQAHMLPLLDEAPMLTAAKVDLLPHQVVLTHRTATSNPRRFLIADEVGLGKTVETALILRELASRGELKRALMVVPAGLIDNWHRELNQVFNLNFEIFGSEGDVTDRKSNAFAKHDRLIASVDTLKRTERIKRLEDAPRWDLVVFDEAHHLNAYRNGTKITRTENYKLAESLRAHCRDLLLLSATPHQGDHFRFWMLIQLLNGGLFHSPEDMLENRHRLNAVVVRRTKADACKPDGSPLFMRRVVHAESFEMSVQELTFYNELRTYLQEGFALAKRQGKQGRALGFVMSVFQKIAASSFAAVRRTLRRRLLNLTIHEAILKDRQLDVYGRENLYEVARTLIREEHGLGTDPISDGEVDRILADSKLRLLKKLDDTDLALLADSESSETVANKLEDAASGTIGIALPEERSIILSLLSYFPNEQETKIKKLLSALKILWQQDQSERVVIFTTYLGTVDLVEREIDAAFPGQGVVVLRGGDHSAKLTAERRFRQENGPRVLVCTAAGREGINLQFSRILFNFDLPWNPMDIEQRIGRIHRYGQKHTAQVYNLVLSDTIEGKIFLLLNQKLNDIAKAVGKVDENGNIAEDFRSQVLGQLAEKLNYDRLYQDALSDPELKRTQLELEQALSNAEEARVVVFELFQDLEGFSIEDYKPFADTSVAMAKLVSFAAQSLRQEGKALKQIDPTTYDVRGENEQVLVKLTTNRTAARQERKLDLLGLDHPIVQDALTEWKNASPESLGISVASPIEETGILTAWLIEANNSDTGELKSYIQHVAINRNGRRLPDLEANFESIFQQTVAPSDFVESERLSLLSTIEPMLYRELQHKGIVTNQTSFTSKLICWIELSPGQNNFEVAFPSKLDTVESIQKENSAISEQLMNPVLELDDYISENSEIQPHPASAEAKLLLDHAEKNGFTREEMNQVMFSEYEITNKTFSEKFTWDVMRQAVRYFSGNKKL